MTTLQTWEPNLKVEGTYCGVTFRGELICEGEFGCRPTPDYRNSILEIRLDAPITVFGQERDRLSIWSNSKGDEVRAADEPNDWHQKVERDAIRYQFLRDIVGLHPVDIHTHYPLEQATHSLNEACDNAIAALKP